MPKTLLLASLFVAAAIANDYHVGPGQAYSALGQVPWYALQAGDTVYIHYQPTPYYEKFQISGRGNASQWIRVLGVPGPNGELPVISGNNATTSSNNHFNWQSTDGNGIQWDGVVHIAPRSDDPTGTPPLPGYIEIANLQVQDGYQSYSFTAENGTRANYDIFASCIYSRSAQHVVIRNTILTNCGLGFYNWTGSGTQRFDGLQADTVLRGNYIYNNGVVGNYSEHQTYTESDGVTIEYNHYGPPRTGMLGSQLKDRSSGTVIRYNHIEGSPQGWLLDLVEAQNGAPAISSNPTYLQTFVYGNLLTNLLTQDGSFIHWNADQGIGLGRADLGGRLYFYHNTFVITRDQNTIFKFPVFSMGDGGQSCPGSVSGVIDVRNNIFANLPKTAGGGADEMYFGSCGYENFNFGKNWISPGANLAYSYGSPYSGTATGLANWVSPSNNNPGFVSLVGADFHLAPGSSSAGIGSALAPQITSNTLALDLTPAQQYASSQHTIPRAVSGAGSDAGAFQNPADCPGAPASAMDSLSAFQTSTPFPISWHLNSSNAGVQSYSVFVSDNGGPFTPLPAVSATQTPFTGVGGHQYGFFSIARDASSRTECAKYGAEASTMVLLPGSCSLNATSQFTITRGAFRLNAGTGRFTQTVTIGRTGLGVASAPFALALDGLTPGVSLFQATGLTSCSTPASSPYLLLNPGSTTWSPGQNLTILLEFVNPAKVGITYTARLLQGGTNR